MAEAEAGRQAIDQCIETKPDVAIFDYSLPLINGIQATREVRLHAPSVRVLIFTMDNNESLLRESFAAGAHGYLTKSEGARYLVAAVERVAANRGFFTASRSQALVDRPQSEETLTAREQDVARLAAEGGSNKRIADMLDISVKTVETHRSAIRRKLNLTSTAELVRYALRNKLIESD